MSGFSHNTLQKALYQKLTGNIPLMAQISGVFDRPDGAVFPYITLGEANSVDWSSKTTVGTEQHVTLYVWSQEGGRKQVALLMESVYGLLHDATMTVEGQTLVLMRFVSSDIQLADDGVTYRGALRLRILLQAN